MDLSFPINKHIYSICSINYMMVGYNHTVRCQYETAACCYVPFPIF